MGFSIENFLYLTGKCVKESLGAEGGEDCEVKVFPKGTTAAAAFEPERPLTEEEPNDADLKKVTFWLLGFF